MGGVPKPQTQPVAMVAGGIDPGLRAAFVEYCKLTTGQGKPRFDPAAPQMSQAQFIRLLQDARLAQPDGPVSTTTASVIFAAFKPMGSANMLFPHFLRSMGALSTESGVEAHLQVANLGSQAIDLQHLNGIRAVPETELVAQEASPGGIGGRAQRMLESHRAYSVPYMVPLAITRAAADKSGVTNAGKSGTGIAGLHVMRPSASTSGVMVNVANVKNSSPRESWKTKDCRTSLIPSVQPEAQTWADVFKGGGAHANYKQGDLLSPKRSTLLVSLQQRASADSQQHQQLPTTTPTTPTNANNNKQDPSWLSELLLRLSTLEARVATQVSGSEEAAQTASEAVKRASEAVERCSGLETQVVATRELLGDMKTVLSGQATTQLSGMLGKIVQLQAEMAYMQGDIASTKESLTQDSVKDRLQQQATAALAANAIQQLQGRIATQETESKQDALAKKELAPPVPSTSNPPSPTLLEITMLLDALRLEFLQRGDRQDKAAAEGHANLQEQVAATGQQLIDMKTVLSGQATTQLSGLLGKIVQLQAEMAYMQELAASAPAVPAPDTETPQQLLLMQRKVDELEGVLPGMREQLAAAVLAAAGTAKVSERLLQKDERIASSAKLVDSLQAQITALSASMQAAANVSSATDAAESAIELASDLETKLKQFERKLQGQTAALTSMEAVQTSHSLRINTVEVKVAEGDVTADTVTRSAPPPAPAISQSEWTAAHALMQQQQEKMAVRVQALETKAASAAAARTVAVGGQHVLEQQSAMEALSGEMHQIKVFLTGQNQTQDEHEARLKHLDQVISVLSTAVQEARTLGLQSKLNMLSGMQGVDDTVATQGEVDALSFKLRNMEEKLTSSLMRMDQNLLMMRTSGTLYEEGGNGLIGRPSAGSSAFGLQPAASLSGRKSSIAGTQLKGGDGLVAGGGVNGSKNLLSSVTINPQRDKLAQAVVDMDGKVSLMEEGLAKLKASDEATKLRTKEVAEALVALSSTAQSRISVLENTTSSFVRHASETGARAGTGRNSEQGDSLGGQVAGMSRLMAKKMEELESRLTHAEQEAGRGVKVAISNEVAELAKAINQIRAQLNMSHEFEGPSFAGSAPGRPSQSGPDTVVLEQDIKGLGQGVVALHAMIRENDLSMRQALEECVSKADLAELDHKIASREAVLLQIAQEIDVLKRKG